MLQRQRNKDTDSPERSPNTSFTNEFITDDQRTSDVTRLRQRRMSTQLKVKATALQIVHNCMKSQACIAKHSSLALVNIRCVECILTTSVLFHLAELELFALLLFVYVCQNTRYKCSITVNSGIFASAKFRENTAKISE